MCYSTVVPNCHRLVDTAWCCRWCQCSSWHSVSKLVNMSSVSSTCPVWYRRGQMAPCHSAQSAWWCKHSKVLYRSRSVNCSHCSKESIGVHPVIAEPIYNTRCYTHPSSKLVMLVYGLMRELCCVSVLCTSCSVSVASQHSSCQRFRSVLQV